MQNFKLYTVLELGKGNVITLNKYASNPKGKDELIGAPKVIITLPSMFSIERALLARSLDDWSGSVQDEGMLKHLISCEFNKIRRTFLRDISKADQLNFVSKVDAQEVQVEGKTRILYNYDDAMFITEHPKPSVEAKTPVKVKTKIVGPKGASL